jgi:hypothetical protein
MSTTTNAICARAKTTDCAGASPARAAQIDHLLGGLEFTPVSDEIALKTSPCLIAFETSSMLLSSM